MKKLIIVCLLLASANTFAQSILKRLSFGLKAGANYSNFTNADFSTDPLVGFHAGVLVNLKLTDKFSIQEEFVFSSQGAKFNEDFLGNKEIKIYYLNVPILFKYRTNMGLYFEAGPQVSMRLSEDMENMPEEDFSQQIDVGVAGGLGYQSKTGFGIGVRYCAGLSKVANFEIGNTKPEFRTDVAQASIFYIF